MNRSARLSFASGALARSQRIHALAILLAPLPLSAWALARSASRGFTLVEPLTLGLSYSLALIGITVGYHRLLSHRAFAPRPWLADLLAVLGASAAQGPPLYWTANHRRHHQFSDRDGDPHSPHQGDGPGWRRSLHAHCGWTLDAQLTNTQLFCKDLLRDPRLMRVNRHYKLWVLAGLALPTALGAALDGAAGALTGLLWGGAVRLLLSYHATNAVNSLGHLFGRRPFPTREHSRNCWPLALPTFGEGWHNNHHAFPTSARLGLSIYELDLGWWFLWTCRKLGWVHDLNQPSAAQIAARRTNTIDSPSEEAP